MNSEKWLSIKDTVKNFEALGWWEEADVPDREFSQIETQVIIKQ